MGILWWLLIAAATVVPMFKLLPHFGIKNYWAFLGVIPLGALVLLWWMTMKLMEMEQR